KNATIATRSFSAWREISTVVQAMPKLKNRMNHSWGMRSTEGIEYMPRNAASRASSTRNAPSSKRPAEISAASAPQTRVAFKYRKSTAVLARSARAAQLASRVFERGGLDTLAGHFQAGRMLSLDDARRLIAGILHLLPAEHVAL